MKAATLALLIGCAAVSTYCVEIRSGYMELARLQQEGNYLLQQPITQHNESHKTLPKPPTFNLARALQVIDRYANRYHVDIVALRVGDKTQAGDFVEHSLHIALRATYASVIRFLSALLAASAPFELHALNIKANQGRPHEKIPLSIETVFSFYSPNTH